MAHSVDIAELGEDDLESVCAFLRREAAADVGEHAAAAHSADHLRWFVFENPARGPGVPAGWVARRDGEIVGAKLCSPQRFRCNGRSYRCLMGGAWYVSEGARGAGLSLLKRYVDLGASHVLFTTTVNETSGSLYERFGAYPIADSDHELLGVLRWPPLVEEWLRRRFGRPGLARLAARAAALRPSSLSSRGGLELERVEDPASLARAGVEPPPELDGVVTAERDAAFLAWRYDPRRDPTCALYRFDGGRGSPCWVAVNLRRRGARAQIRSLQVLDLWGALAPEALPALAAALAARHAHEADVLVFRGQPESRRAALLSAGFARRDFARAIGVCIDRAGLLPTRSWYLVPADGDMGH